MESESNDFYDEYSYRKENNLPIGWLLFFVKNSNNNGGSIFISDVSGEHLTPLINEVDYIKKEVRLNEDSVLIFYSSKDTMFVSEIKLSVKKVIQTKELPKIQ